MSIKTEFDDPTKLPFCECGCGLRVTKHGNRFLRGHHRRGKKNSPEQNAAISATMKGVPKSPRTPRTLCCIIKSK